MLDHKKHGRINQLFSSVPTANLQHFFKSSFNSSLTSMLESAENQSPCHFQHKELLKIQCVRNHDLKHIKWFLINEIKKTPQNDN